jgi:hypothetical protein
MEELDHKVRVACGLVIEDDKPVGQPIAANDKEDQPSAANNG